jgi:AhpD family alkylhydroperoxidase
MTTRREPRVRRLDRDEIRDAQLQGVLERAERLSTPRPEWYQTLGHAPDVAVGYAAYWELTHRGGRVEHTTKELMRIAISAALGCDFCAEQRSVRALDDGLSEAEASACAAPGYAHPDPRVRAALRLARSIVADGPTTPVDWDDVYRELRSVYDDAEIVELGCFAAMALGGVKLSRSLNQAQDATDGRSADIDERSTHAS